jgi:uncharacterized protein YyaL (SSP411 family)
MTERDSPTVTDPKQSTAPVENEREAATKPGNRLSKESSLYLRQHRDNPVDWFPWGEEAFARARAEDKPVLLSIGYSACHWCHVMARESFEDQETAALMNARFVNVKVDREERPDVDALYMQALTSMGQRGGWPLTMFLTPDGTPFWGGTYFPPKPSRDLPSFPQLLVEISDFFQQDREAVVRNTSAVSAALARSRNAATDDGFDVALAMQTAEALLERVDFGTGGLAGTPKFPHAPTFRFLWHTWLRTGRSPFKESVIQTLKAMSQGGIYDHLAGGYARYAVDEKWTMPHFEKMLYDNAQLLELLTLAWSGTEEQLFADRTRETVAWVLQEMVTGSGAFAASLAAESEGEEGLYYTWTRDEIEVVLGDAAALFAKIYGVARKGLFEGRCVLHRALTPTEFDKPTERQLADCRRNLLAARAKRVSPMRDNTILADWNGLMIAALARASAVFGEPSWLAAAQRAFDFVVSTMDRDGTLCHTWLDGNSRTTAILDDYANMARAALILSESSGELHYIDQARIWSETVLANYGDQYGGFFMTPETRSDMFMRLQKAEDDATPSGNSVMLEVLVRLHVVSGEDRFGEAADRLSRAFTDEPAQNLPQMASFIDANQFAQRPVQVVIVGASTERDAAALRTAVYHSRCPDFVLTTVELGREFSSNHPAYGKSQLGNRATAYICVGQTCSAPTTDPDALVAALSGPTNHNQYF